jgi:hypothetical protein
VVKGHPTTYISIFDNNRPMKARKLFVDRTGAIHDEFLVCEKEVVVVLDFDPQSVLQYHLRFVFSMRWQVPAASEKSSTVQNLPVKTCTQNVSEPGLTLPFLFFSSSCSYRLVYVPIRYSIDEWTYTAVCTLSADGHERAGCLRF